MNVSPEDLTPLEKAIQNEGMAMLDKVQELKREAGESIILGEDGKPIKTEKSIKPPGDDQLSHEEIKNKAMEDARLRVERNAKRLSDIMESNPHAAQCATTIHAAWQLLYWVMNDLLTIPELSDELVQQLADHLRAAAMHKGYSVNELLSKLKNTCIPFMHDRISYYAQEKRRRDVKIKEVEKRMGSAGIALPCQSLRSLFKDKEILRPGGMLVLHGRPEALRIALRLCARYHIDKNSGHPFYLSTEERPETSRKDLSVMPIKWWQGKASSIVEMEETLRPVVDSRHTVLLLVEDANKLWVADERERSADHLKVKATARLYQWAYNNQVAVILGDAGEFFNEQLYGDLPTCKVALAELDCKSHITIGNDVIAVEEENFK